MHSHLTKVQYINSQCSWVDDSHGSVGSALARFERSTIPDHEGTRTIVLRFLKIITPVKCTAPLYDGRIKQPKEGELFQKAGKPWSINIDNPKGAMVPGLRLLWDV